MLFHNGEVVVIGPGYRERAGELAEVVALFRRPLRLRRKGVDGSPGAVVVARYIIRTKDGNLAVLNETDALQPDRVPTWKVIKELTGWAPTGAEV